MIRYSRLSYETRISRLPVYLPKAGRHESFCRESAPPECTTTAVRVDLIPAKSPRARAKGISQRDPLGTFGTCLSGSIAAGRNDGRDRVDQNRQFAIVNYQFSRFSPFVFRNSSFVIEFTVSVERILRSGGTLLRMTGKSEEPNPKPQGSTKLKARTLDGPIRLS